MSPQRVQSVERSIDILMALVDSPQTLTEVTRRSGLSKGTAFRLLSSLSYRGLVLKDPHRSVYMLGPGFLRLTQGATMGLGSLAMLARPALSELWEATSETVAVHIQVGAERMCIEELPSPQPIRYVSTVGASAPLYVGSAGRVLLAFAPEQELKKSLLSLPRLAAANGYPLDLAEFEATLAEIRNKGFATSVGERIRGAAAISVPLFGPELFASLSVLGPTERLTDERLLEMLPLVQSAAAAIKATFVKAGRESRTQVVVA